MRWAGGQTGAGVFVGLLLVVSVLGEGGGHPTALLLLHGLLVLALLWDRLSPEPASRGLPPAVASAYGLFLLVAAVSAAQAPYAYAALLGFLELVAFLVVAHLAARAGPGALQGWAAVLLLAAGAQGAWATLQRWMLGEARPAGTFLNPNHLAIWLGAALLLALGALGEKWRWWVATAAACSGLGILWSGSRGALLGLVAGVATMVTLDRRGAPRRRNWAVVGAAVLLLAAAGAALRFKMPDPYRYFRLRLWSASLRSVSAHPWFGTGPRQWAAEAPRWNPPLEEGPLRWERMLCATHSDYLRLPAELGLAGLVAALVAVGAWWRALPALRFEPGRLPAVVGAFGALAALAAHAGVDNLSERPALYLLAAALLGACVSQPRATLSAPRRWPQRLAWAAGLLAAFALLDIAPYRAWLEMGRAQRDPERAASHLQRARARNPYHYDPWLREAEALARPGWTLDDYARAREWSEHALRLQPADASVRLRRARIERRAFFDFLRDVASRDRVERLYREAIARSPKDPWLHLELGEFLLAAADPAGARRAAGRALALEPNLVPARLLLAEALLVSGDPAARSRADRLLVQAREISERWRSRARESGYARRALSLDPAWAARIEARLGEAP